MPGISQLRLSEMRAGAGAGSTWEDVSDARTQRGPGRHVEGQCQNGRLEDKSHRPAVASGRSESPKTAHAQLLPTRPCGSFASLPIAVARRQRSTREHRRMRSGAIDDVLASLDVMCRRNHVRARWPRQQADGPEPGPLKA